MAQASQQKPGKVALLTTPFTQKQFISQICGLAQGQLEYYGSQTLPRSAQSLGEGVETPKDPLQGTPNIPLNLNFVPSKSSYITPNWRD